MLEFALRCGQLAVADFGHPGEFPGALVALFFSLELLDCFFQPANPPDGFFFHLPVSLPGARLLAQLSELRFDLLQPLARVRVGLLQQRLALDLQLQDAPLDFVNFHRQRINLHAQAGRSLVNQVDGLVREKAIGDVAVRERRRGQDGRVFDAHAVVYFVALLEPAQDGDGIGHRGFGNQHGLEAPLERRVFLNVFAILVQRSGADGAQFAARQRRLEHV